VICSVKSGITAVFCLRHMTVVLDNISCTFDAWHQNFPYLSRSKASGYFVLTTVTVLMYQLSPCRVKNKVRYTALPATALGFQLYSHL
jgi:hypothetical protein